TRWWSPDCPVEPMYIAGRFRTPSRPLRTWMFRASYEWPSLVGVVNVAASSRGWLNSLFLLAAHRRQPDRADPGFGRKLRVDLFHDSLAEDGEMAHPDRSLHFDQQFRIAHPDGAGSLRHVGAHDLEPDLGRLRGREMRFELEGRQHLVEHGGDRLEMAPVTGLHAVPLAVAVAAAGTSAGAVLFTGAASVSIWMRR